MEKLLSVIIPAYNTELYLARCLDSLLYNTETVEKLDIIIVNDGSTDETPKIAEKYRQQFPGSITVINKENGGHGSTINAGIKVARGKYLKVIDSDDWVNIWDFAQFVEGLKDETADLLITDFDQDILYDTTVEKKCFYSGDDAEHKIEDAFQAMQENNFFYMHAFTVKLKKLKAVWGDGLLEKTFYVDQQYDIKVFECAETYKVLPYNIYKYFIGRPEQSMNDVSKHYSDHQRVISWLLGYYYTEAVQDKDYLKEIIKWQAALMLDCHKSVYGSEKRQAKKEFFRQLKAQYAELIPDNL